MFVRIILIVGLAVLIWSALARSSDAHGAKQVVTVRPYETLWSIAQRHYAGDLRDAIARNRVKLEIGLAKGKRQYDKREAIAAKDARREMDRAVKSRA